MKHTFFLLVFWLCTLATSAQSTSLPSIKPPTTPTKDVELFVEGQSVGKYTRETYDSLIVVDNLGIKLYLKGRKSLDFLSARYKVIENPIIPSGDNVNRNTDFSDMRAWSWRLEYPRLSTENNQFISVHQTNSYGITYSLEWDGNKKAQRWTCLQHHHGIPHNKIGRSHKGAWLDDENIPEAYRTHDADYKKIGFSRGHMCMSNERQASKEQNAQTFYISNAHPQKQSHNGGLWLRMEQQVIEWGENLGANDTLYVVKAGTIRDGQVLDPTSTGLLVPAHFYMALLRLKNGRYEAMAFWTNHDFTQGYGKEQELKEFAISVDELEQKTGIDFFCNLPDNIEEHVEKDLHIDQWQWKVKKEPKPKKKKKQG